MRPILLLIACLCISPLVLAADTPAPLPAFPGAEGAGAFSLGGRGGKVYAVTTLADYNPKAKKDTPIPGSLRWAVSQLGPRTVVFCISGQIKLLAPLAITEPRLTIAGQTAPGDGICLTTFGCQIHADDVVVRHLRFRPGDEAGKELDALAVYQCRRVIVDHCSTSWSIDESLSVTGEGCGDVSVQWCLIAESLDESKHHKGTHGYGSLIRTDGAVTYHHNLYAHHRTRCPRPGTYGQPPGILFDFRNNVIYDWIGPAGYSSEDPVRMNYVDNYLKPGPSTKKQVSMFTVGGPATKIYAAGNVLEHPERTGAADWDLIERATPESRAAAAFATPSVTTDSAPDALKRVLDTAGALLPRRDAVDERIVAEVRSGTGRVINSQQDVGGWPTYATTQPPVDRDEDGLPDDWEQKHGFSSSDPTDGASDADGDGYTNLEEYLNGTNPRH